MAEQRLIDASAMREFVLHEMLNEKTYCANDFLDVIDAQPTVDAIKGVRCNDCNLSMPAYTKGKMSETEIYCPFLDIRKPNDWHCGDGLRKRTDAETIERWKAEKNKSTQSEKGTVQENG